MTRTSWLITLFWTFIIGMLLWQFANYNQGLTQQGIAHPKAKDYFYYNTGATPQAMPPPKPVEGPNLVQTNYTVEDNKPTNGMITAHVTLKNLGTAKAIDVQVNVRPYRGAVSGDSDMGHTQSRILDDNDADSLYGQWVSFPDLAPGESATENASFLAKPGFAPGGNLNPQIIFSKEKAKP